MQIKNKRTCIITRKKLDKEELIRFKYDKFTNEIIIDWNQNMLGRGFYISKEPQKIQKAIDYKILQKNIN